MLLITFPLRMKIQRQCKRLNWVYFTTDRHKCSNSYWYRLNLVNLWTEWLLKNKLHFPKTSNQETCKVHVYLWVSHLRNRYLQWCMYCRRRRVELHGSKIAPRKGVNLMIWEWFSSGRVGDLQHVQGILNQHETTPYWRGMPSPLANNWFSIT